VNKQGTDSYQAKLTYVGALTLPRNSLQRIKFDITQAELLVGPVDERPVFHPYEDAPSSTPAVRC
jgi:hypothetical protein